MGLNDNTNPLPGVGYTGSVIVQRDRESKNINGVYYVDISGNWVEYGSNSGGSGHSFGFLVPDASNTITNSFEFEEVST